MTTKEDLTLLYREKLNTLNDDSKKMSNISIKVYVGNIIKLALDMKKPLEPSTFLNFKMIKQFIADNNKSLATQKNKLNSVVVYLKAMDGDY